MIFKVFEYHKHKNESNKNRNTSFRHGETTWNVEGRFQGLEISKLTKRVLQAKPWGKIKRHRIYKIIKPKFENQTNSKCYMA